MLSAITIAVLTRTDAGKKSCPRLEKRNLEEFYSKRRRRRKLDPTFYGSAWASVQAAITILNPCTIPWCRKKI
jgi:hypothetical protein